MTMAKSSKPSRQVDDRHLRLEYLGSRCAVCRRSIAAIERRFLTSKGTVEFNHVDPDRKSPIYEKLIRRVLSAAQLDELDKCNLLCRICHGAWTNQRLRARSHMTFTLPDGRIVKKTILWHGLMEIEKQKPKFHLFADEPCHLEVYVHSLGGSRRIFRLGFELEKDLARLLLATRRRRTLRVWDKEGLVFIATKLDDKRLKVEFLTRFAVIKFEGVPDDPGCPRVWVRNGKMIIRGQRIRKKGGFDVEMEYAAVEHALKSKAS
jgi:hypothetical protein